MLTFLSPQSPESKMKSAIQTLAIETNHEGLEDLKGASAFAFYASAKDFFKVFVVHFFCPFPPCYPYYLNHRTETGQEATPAKPSSPPDTLNASAYGAAHIGDRSILLI